eukprot:scaffold4334_cov117-Skeletonema_menzelii.AAC.5
MQTTLGVCKDVSSNGYKLCYVWLALKEQCHDLVVKARAGCSFIHSSVQRLERYEKPGKGGRDKYDKTQFRAVLVYL